MATSTDTGSLTSTSTLTNQATTVQQTQARIASYTDFVSADVAKADNGLKGQLEAGAKARLKF